MIREETRAEEEVMAETTLVMTQVKTPQMPQIVGATLPPHKPRKGYGEIRFLKRVPTTRAASR
jgi:hypothetical protein